MDSDDQKDKPLPETPMDIADQKDKPLPEAPSPMDAADNQNSPPENIKKDAHDNSDHPENNSEAGDQHLPQNHGVDDASSSPKPGPEVPDPNTENAEDLEVKGEHEEPAQVKHQEESFPLPPDLNKLSQDIDQFLSSLSNLSEGGESTPPDLPIFVEQFMVLVEAKIEEYDSGDIPVKWDRLTVGESASYLEAVNRVSSVSKALAKFSSQHKYASSINDFGRILQRAMSYVEEEFKLLLEDHKIHDSSDPSHKTNDSKHNQSSNQESDENPHHESSSPEEETNISGYSEEILSDLIRLSKAMITGGYEAECCQVYYVVRRNALEENLNKLGFEKHSIDDVHKMSWETLERETESWIKTFKKIANLHFSSERKLSEAVFSDYPSISQNLLGSLSHGVTLQFLNFAEGIALTKRSGEKLFKFLDIYETLRDTLPVIDNLFPEEWAAELKNEASIIRSHLGEAMISIFNELENSIKADSGKTQVPGGAVHPLTKYIMNYLEYACEYKGTLEQVFREHQKIERADSNPGSEYDYNSQTQNPSNEKVVARQSPFQAQIIKTMELQDANVEGKSKLYKDPSLSSIFMMNNGRYTLKKIKGSADLNSLMGETWYRKKSSDLRQYHKGYQRETWGKLLNCLHPEGLTVKGKVMKPVLKERFKSFNAMFDEIHKTQSNWVVGDEQLQSELRVSISNMVIPAYRSFLGRYGQTFTPGRQTEKYVKFQPEDIETYIDDLFDGNAAPMGRKKV
ncbi:Exocyst complex component EXO70B1 [Sesamum angolense]|uniref:Exocyst subunit Exo70 family protein n=1 Tax=Sesamum angolense TaxID=2727404 RepID=A0AAE1WGD1_9LAMI|nr:Exocyst complex component EXO70B1 [Sesamum angolense]